MLGLVDKAEDNPKLSSLIGSEDWLVVDRLLRRARRAGQATEQTQLESRWRTAAGCDDRDGVA